MAAIAGAIGIVGYQAGWFDKLLGQGKWERKADKDKFKAMGLAAWNYKDTHQVDQFPTNISDNEGKPLLSWRVRVLPYLDRKDLYDQFKLDEPWDSEHNKKLIDKMPELFAIAGSKASDGKTFIQAFEGEAGTTVRPFLVKGEQQGLKHDDVKDGASNTTMFIEARDAVTWTKPEDLAFTPEGPLPKIGGHSGQKPIMGVMDGRVWLLSDNELNDNKLRAYATINGGENVEADDPTPPPKLPPKPEAELERK